MQEKCTAVYSAHFTYTRKLVKEDTASSKFKKRCSCGEKAAGMDIAGKHNIIGHVFAFCMLICT